MTVDTHPEELISRLRAEIAHVTMSRDYWKLRAERTEKAALEASAEIGRLNRILGSKWADLDQAGRYE